MVVPLGWALWPAGDGSLQLIRDSTVIGTEQHLFSKEVLQNSNTVPWLARSCRSRCISLWISNVCVWLFFFVWIVQETLWLDGCRCDFLDIWEQWRSDMIYYKIKDMEKGWDFAIQFIFILPKGGPHPVVTEATVGAAHAMLPSQNNACTVTTLRYPLKFAQRKREREIGQCHYHDSNQHLIFWGAREPSR